MSDSSPETICTNCGKPYEKHFLDRDRDWVYCYEDTNGDFFTTEPTPEMLLEMEVSGFREQLKQAQSEIARLRQELESMTQDKKDILDTTKACLVAAGGSEDEDELLRQLNKAGRKPSDFIRSQLDKLRQENERLRKDAERYEYLRRYRRTTAIYKYVCGVRVLEIGDQLDAAIDAAKESQQ